MEDSFLESQAKEFLKRQSFAREDIEKDLNRYRVPQISITSVSGAGKSSLMEGLKRVLGPTFRYVSGGTFMRQKASELGISIEEFSQFNKEHPEVGYDIVCDTLLLMQAFNPKPLVMESRMAHVWVLGGFHVLLTCPLAVRAERRRKQIIESSGNQEINFGWVMSTLNERDCHNAKSYDKLYPGWCWKETDYDLVIDTSTVCEKEVVKLVVDGYKDWHNPAHVRTLAGIRSAPMCCAAY